MADHELRQKLAQPCYVLLAEDMDEFFGYVGDDDVLRIRIRVHEQTSVSTSGDDIDGDADVGGVDAKAAKASDRALDRGPLSSLQSHLSVLLETGAGRFALRCSLFAVLLLFCLVFVCDTHCCCCYLCVLRCCDVLVCSDVAIVVDGTRLPAHQTILCARSPYFKVSELLCVFRCVVVCCLLFASSLSC